MTKATTTIAPVPFASLPAVGTPLADGTFAGIHSQPDGTHVAVVLLSAWSEGLTWKKALTWAKKQDGQLPTRPVAALLFANLKAQLQPRWHWTSEEDDDSSAWLCNITGGYQDYLHKSFEGCAVAVRLIPLTA